MHGITYGYAGRILCIDLTTGEHDTQDSMAYARDVVGGLGMAAMIAYRELPPGVGPFDPENPLMLMAGPLSGTLVPGCGRVSVCGIAPQQNPPRFSRSNMGGHWGPELKYAGYDGVVIRGHAERPVYLWIHDRQVEIRDAAELWGRGTYDTTQTLRRMHGPKTRAIVIGPAGENRSRIATLQTETGNVAGQGGFGGVMGSKNLKAVAVRGTLGVAVADPEAVTRMCLDKTRESYGIPPAGADPHFMPPGRRAEPREMMRMRKCGFCNNVCAHPLIMGMAGVTQPGTITTARQCYGFRGAFRPSIEARSLASDLGLNGWEVTYGIIPWLQMCKQRGLIDQVEGQELAIPEEPLRYNRQTAVASPELNAKLLHMIAHREGELGDALAEGTCYAAQTLFGGAGAPLIDKIYPGRNGQTGHWTTHWGTGGQVNYPWWLPIVMQWCVDTRDPASDSSHGWTTHAQQWLPVSGDRDGPLSLDEVRHVCRKVYGNAEVGNPAYAYDPPELKAIPAIWHTDLAMVMDSMVVCEAEWSRVFSAFTPDHAADTGLLARLYAATTGIEMSETELQTCGARISTLLRAVDVRNHGRTRDDDEAVLDTIFRYPAGYDGVTLDVHRFRGIMDAYYALRGWDWDSGIPTRETLSSLGVAQSPIAEADTPAAPVPTTPTIPITR